MQTIDPIITLASEASPKDYSWALILAAFTVAGTYLFNTIRDLRQGNDKNSHSSNKELRDTRAELDRERHQNLVNLIHGVGEKVDATNRRMDAMERRIAELGESDHKMALEFEKLRADRGVTA